MPSTSQELLDKWGGEQGVGEDKALNFLISKGWKEEGNGFMVRPEGKSEADISEEEWEALQFLHEEWDFGYRGT